MCVRMEGTTFNRMFIKVEFGSSKLKEERIERAKEIFEGSIIRERMSCTSCILIYVCLTGVALPSILSAPRSRLFNLNVIYSSRSPRARILLNAAAATWDNRNYAIS